MTHASYKKQTPPDRAPETDEEFWSRMRKEHPMYKLVGRNIVEVIPEPTTQKEER